MLVDLYCLLMKAFEIYVKILVSDIVGNKSMLIVNNNITKLQNMSKLYLKTYFCFQHFITYCSSNIGVFMLVLSFGFLFLIL